MAALRTFILTIQIPASLEEKISRQQIVPIVAAGVSMSLKDQKGDKVFPSWPELLNRAADKLKEEKKEDEQTFVTMMVKRNRLHEAAKEAKDGLTGSRWNSFYLNSLILILLRWMRLPKHYLRQSGS